MVFNIYQHTSISWHEWKGDGVGCATCTTRAATPDHIQPLYEEDGRKEVYLLKKAEVQLLLPSIYLIQRSDAVGYTGSCDTSGTTRTL